MTDGRRRAGVRGVRALLLLALLVIWQGWAGSRDPLLYVPPSRVLPALVTLIRLQVFPGLLEHLGLTVGEIVAAYALAVLAGLALAFALGLPRHLGEIYEPLLAALNAVASVRGGASGGVRQGGAARDLGHPRGRPSLRFGARDLSLIHI